ncbi:MAG: hypothetical protein ACT6SC_06515, partial [Blastomonas fulva]
MTLNDEYHDNPKPGIAHRVSGGCDADRTGQRTARRTGLFDRALWFDGLHRHCLAAQAPHIAYAAEDGDAVKLYLIDNGRAGMLAMA